MRIQHNIMAMNAYRNYNTNTSALSKNLEKLSSGYKINRAGDDAAGLAISEKMRAQITGLNAAQKNVKDGISLVKTAEGAMQEIQDMLNRMDYLATQSANGTYDNEVDRLNLQKEVNQLRSEINRIADSANFNGIKLLDGKAGINTTAFKSFADVAGVVGHNGSVDLKNLLGNAHTEVTGNSQVNASAVIDISALTAEAASSTDTITMNFEIGGQTYAAKLNGQTTYAASDIAAALKKAMTESSSGVEASSGAAGTSSTDNDSIKIGSNVYKVEVDGNNVKLTLAGVGAGGANYQTVSATPGTTTNEFNQTTADQINKELGMNVKLDSVTGAKAHGGDVVHETTTVTQAKAFKADSLAGVDLELTKDMVQDGAIIEIDGKKFTIQTGTQTPTGGDFNIDLSADKAAGKTDDELIHILADKLSNQTEFTGADGRKWKIGSSNADGKTTIHFEQTGKTTTAGNELKTEDILASKIKVTAPATADKGAGVAITVDTSKIAAGNKLNVDGKTYTFVKGTADAAKGEVSMDGDALANLKAALGSTYEVDVANGTNADEKILTIRSKTGTTANPAAVAASESPVITGEGLQLQIGDTSDSYNQLSVKIGDMHTKALGIADLSIADPEGASAAIQTIRDAINQVSGVRGDLGATQNRLEHTANNLSVMAENIQDAESTIRDTDVAEEMMAYTKNNILVQSAQAMLAQANAVPQGVLQLLG